MTVENLIVTTGAKMESANVLLAEDMARRLSACYVERGRDSLISLRRKYHVAYILIVRHGELFLAMPEGEFFFHPSMAHVRVKNLRQGRPDHFVEAVGLRAGMSVLDCTLGLGADAIVASYVTGAEGNVRALESRPLIAEIVSFGLSHPRETGPMGEAMRRHHGHRAGRHLSHHGRRGRLGPARASRDHGRGIHLRRRRAPARGRRA